MTEHNHTPPTGQDIREHLNELAFDLRDFDTAIVQLVGAYFLRDDVEFLGILRVLCAAADDVRTDHSNLERALLPLIEAHEDQPLPDLTLCFDRTGARVAR